MDIINFGPELQRHKEYLWSQQSTQTIVDTYLVSNYSRPTEFELVVLADVQIEYSSNTKLLMCLFVVVVLFEIVDWQRPILPMPWTRTNTDRTPELDGQTFGIFPLARILITPRITDSSIRCVIKLSRQILHNEPFPVSDVRLNEFHELNLLAFHSSVMTKRNGDIWHSLNCKRVLILSARARIFPYVFLAAW